jgi:integrase
VGWQDNDLAFSTATGTPLDRTNVYRNHLRALRDAGLPHIRIHDFRHTVATLHLEQGESPKIVQERLGHSNISQTLGTYSHVLPAMHRAAADRLDELFSYRPRRSS